jgi:hypothetical protein
MSSHPFHKEQGALMPISRTPHTRSQQNTPYTQTDVNPDESPQEAARDEAYENRAGAETGGKRSPRHTTLGTGRHKTEPQQAAMEGSLTSRGSRDTSRQGISNRAAADEAWRQEKVVSQRDDAQAGVNHSGKAPRE